MPDWISADELAMRTNLHRVTIYRYAREGTIPCIRGHRAIRFSYEDVWKLLRNGAGKSGAIEERQKAIGEGGSDGNSSVL